MTTPTPPQKTIDRTVDELLALNDQDFVNLLSSSLVLAKRSSSSFMDRAVIERTENAVVELLWRVDSTMRQQAEDPDCPSERYQRTLAYRRLLLSAVDSIERRVAWIQGGGRNRLTSAWKDFAEDLASELQASNLSSYLDELMTPIGRLTARQWLEVRGVKQAPAPEKELAA